ncbi:hypothetical protein [Janthinobacterium sp. BJB301]|uniref:hypothetical protein n=1 Tax=Janthinobacterium sp. BJB301 TaxID=1560195 RepID=UPI00117B7AF2|nr:hypothetical protein [Janthinobacterium sp. BJB301]
MRSVVTTRMLAHPGLKKLPRGCRRINVMVHFTEQLAFSNRTIDEGGQKSDVDCQDAQPPHKPYSELQQISDN